MDKIVFQLNRLKKYLLHPDTDISWSYIDDVNEIIERIDLLEKGIRNGNDTAFKELLYLLAPTNDLQEISISSGWGDEFLDIAESLEKQIHYLLER